MQELSTQEGAGNTRWLLALLALMWLVPGFFGHEPWKPDEGYTIGVVKSMVDSGNWIVPTLTHETFMEKPPIFYITATLFASAVSPWLMPLHAALALAGVFYVGLTLYFVYRAGREAGGEESGAFAALGVIGCVGFVVRAHSAITDTALWCGMAIAVYGALLSERRQSSGAFWFGTGAGLAFMAKGLVGPGFLGLGALLLPFFHTPRRNAAYLRFLLLSLLFCLPWLVVWPIALYLHSPELFSVWFFDNNVGRFVGSSGGYTMLATQGKPWKYLAMIPWFTIPLWPSALLAWRRKGREGIHDIGLLYPSLVFLGGLIVLSAAATRRELYFIPLLIPMAIMGCGAGRELPAWLDWPLRRLPIGAGLAAAALAWGVYLLWRFAPYTELIEAAEAFAPGYEPPPSWFAPLAALGYLAVCGWILLGSRLRLRWEWAWAAAMTLAWGTAMLLFVPMLDHVKRYEPVFASMLREVPQAGTASLEEVYLGEAQRAILHYRFNLIPRPVRPGRESAEYVLIHNHRRLSHYPEAPWELVWEGNRPGDTNERYLLYRNGGGGAEPSMREGEKGTGD